MGEISPELQSFKSSVEPSIGTMRSACTTLQETVQSVNTSVTSSASAFNSAYDSSNKSSIINKFGRLSSICSTVANSLGGDLQGMISDADAVVGLVTELENINDQIKTVNGTINSLNNSEDSDAASRKASEQSKLYKLNSDFAIKHNEAIQKLNALKGKDANIAFTSDFSPSNTEANIEDLQYGTFEPREFTASNGLTVQYWLYVPDYGKDVENLPLMLYMHGGSTKQRVSLDGAKKYGLTSYISKHEITPSGIVIMPAVCDFTERGRVALKELTDSVVDEYNCDTDRISVGGHSYGAITAYNLINENPNYFSCCVALSGRAKVTDAFKNVRVWSFNGTYETGSGWTSYNSSVNAVKEINNMGGDAYLTPIKTGHAGTNKMTFIDEYDSPDGDKRYPLEWAFEQEKDAA